MSEFSASVSQYQRESETKLEGGHLFFKKVKDSLDPFGFLTFEEEGCHEGAVVEMECEENLVASLTSDHRIHLYNTCIRMMFHKVLIIFVSAAFKAAGIFDFRLVHMSNLISHFLWKVNVLYGQSSEVDVVIDCFLTKTNFRMIPEDCVWGLTLEYQRGYQFIEDLEIIF